MTFTCILNTLSIPQRTWSSISGRSSRTLVVIVGITVTDRPCRFKNYEANYPKSKDEPVAADPVPIKDLPELPNDADAVSETTYSAMSSVAEIVAGKTPSRASWQVAQFALDC